MAFCARECTLIARLHLLLQRLTSLGRSEPCIDGHRRLVFREQNPVTVLPGELAPRLVDVVTEGNENVSLVLSAPRRWPGRDGALSNRQRVIRDHGLLRHLVDATKPMAPRTSAFRRVR